MKIEGNKVIFSSGLVANANEGAIGITPCGEVTEGYDGMFLEWHEMGRDMTREEREELADHMIKRWRRFRDKEGK